jgi:hypothetical protein
MVASGKPRLATSELQYKPWNVSRGQILEPSQIEISEMESAELSQAEYLDPPDANTCQKSYNEMTEDIKIYA